MSKTYLVLMGSVTFLSKVESYDVDGNLIDAGRKMSATVILNVEPGGKISFYHKPSRSWGYFDDGNVRGSIMECKSCDILVPYCAKGASVLFFRSDALTDYLIFNGVDTMGWVKDYRCYPVVGKCSEDVKDILSSEDVWKLARKLYDISSNNSLCLFGYASVPEILEHCSPREVFDIIESHPDIVNNNIQVGEVLESDVSGVRIMVLCVNASSWVVLNGDGKSFVVEKADQHHWHTTGEFIDISSILDQLKGKVS